MPIPGREHETETQWAYPPYLSTLKRGAGPLVSTSYIFERRNIALMIKQHLVAVPVSREDCSVSSNNTENLDAAVQSLSPAGQWIPKHS
jgi:hypothetical protein